MQLSRYFRVVRHRLWMIVACPILAAAAAGIVSLVLPPVYEAKVDLAVRSAQVLPSTDPNAPSVSNATILATYALWMTEPQLINKVIADLQLKTTAAELVKEIKVTPDPLATVLHITVQDTNPSLARDVATTLVAEFQMEVKNVQKTETQTPDNLVVISDAVLPDKPVAPNKTLNVEVAFSAGLLLALGAAFLLDYLDQSVKSDEDLTDRTGLTPLGHIAFVPAGQGKRGELVTLDASSHASEAYRALRTNLLFSAIDQELKVIVITSAEQGEGKSRTAANLAVVLAHAENKTLLVDADFRRPSQHRIFGRVRNVGLSNLILKDATDKEAISSVEAVPNLWLLTSGPTPPNPSELLGSTRMKELMVRLSKEFTYVIVDTPPINAVTDSSILAASASGTVLVVEQGRTSFPALIRGKQTLDRVGAHTIGAVLNKLRASQGSYSYEYGYYASSSDGQSSIEPDAPSKPHESEPRALSNR